MGSLRHDRVDSSGSHYTRETLKLTDAGTLLFSTCGEIELHCAFCISAGIFDKVKI